MSDEITWQALQYPSHLENGKIQWRDFLDPRQLSEIDFDVVYAKQFAHGTSGHNERMIVARLVELLDTICANAKVE